MLALNPDLDAVRTQQPTAVDPPRYRLVSMRIEHRLDDGSVDDVNIQTLQPTSWLARHNVERYRTAPVPLDLEELGVHGTAVVTLIEPCPPIEEGRGAVVLTTVNHLSDAVYELTVTTPDGLTETLTPTANQPFYCLDENDWLPTEELLKGDRLRTHTGEVTVTRVTTRPGRHRVYNLTVETEHAYHVSALGVVSHNTCSINGGGHHTRTPRHKEFTDKTIKKLADSGDYKAIYGNRGVNKILGHKLTKNRRPDIVAIRKDGTIDLYEIRSKTDKIKDLTDRMNEIKKQLPNLKFGELEVLEIK